jgi:ammonia channel protein AmtB
MTDDGDYLWALFMVAFVVAGLVALCAASADCDRRGGVLVGAVVGYECVEKR